VRVLIVDDNENDYALGAPTRRPREDAPTWNSSATDRALEIEIKNDRVDLLRLVKPLHAQRLLAAIEKGRRRLLEAFL
jgi:hypothetical protein